MPNPGQALKPRVKLGKRADDCWTWQGLVTDSGHGKLTFCGRDTLAHRWLWEQLFGPIPKGWVVFSTCESKQCVNPHHLACGMQAEANRAGVHVKLLPADVADIKAMQDAAGPNTARVLAERYDVSENTVRDIWRGNSWARSKRNNGPKNPRNQYSRAA